MPLTLTPCARWSTQHWCLQSDVALLAALLLAVAARMRRDKGPWGWLRAFGGDEAAAMLSRASSSIRVQLFYFYVRG